MIVRALAASFLIAVATPARAAPSQLLNKTLTVNVTIAMAGKGTDGSLVNVASPVQRVIYISGAGRVFSRVTRSVGNAREQAERGPEAGNAAGSLNFSGNKLVGVIPAQTGASLWTIAFDPDFKSCNAEVVMGRDNGKPIVWKGLNGVIYTATGRAVISGLSCSIRDGNALAN